MGRGARIRYAHILTCTFFVSLRTVTKSPVHEHGDDEGVFALIKRICSTTHQQRFNCNLSKLVHGLLRCAGARSPRARLRPRQAKRRKGHADKVLERIYQCGKETVEA